MSSFSYFRAGSVSSPRKYVEKVDAFVGVDYVHPQTKVAKGRGIFSKNYAWIDNMAQKRWAYDKIGYVPKEWIRPIDYETETAGDAIENPSRFNGMWSFVADDGSRRTVAHIGHFLFEVINLESGRPRFKPILFSRDGFDNCSYKLVNDKTWACPGLKRLWLLGGEKYLMVYLAKVGSQWKWQIEQVAYSDYAFVPTTTTHITYKGATSTGYAGLDYPNMMSKFRNNLLLTGVGKEEAEGQETKFFEYTLDAPIVPENETEDMYASEIEIEYTGIVED